MNIEQIIERIPEPRAVQDLVATAQDMLAAFPLEEVLKKAYYYDTDGNWRDSADTEELDRWHDVAKVVIALVAKERERIAKMVAGERFRDGDKDSRRGPGGVGTWHESSPMGYTMRELSRLIRGTNKEIDR